MAAMQTMAELTAAAVQCGKDAAAAKEAKSTAEQRASEKQAAASAAKEELERATLKHQKHADELGCLEEALRACEVHLGCLDDRLLTLWVCQSDVKRTEAAFTAAKASAEDATTIEDKAC